MGADQQGKGWRNVLHYGDNLDVLRAMDAGSVDLVYLDPPFSSNEDYNILFRAPDGTDAPAQVKAFEDTWAFDEKANRGYEELVQMGKGELARTAEDREGRRPWARVSQVMEAFNHVLGASPHLAYLTMMALRLVELRRVMKPTASIYLHCDPTASHHLKLLMDAVFGRENFRNEIVWKRQSAHSDARSKFADVTDTILFYAHSPKARFRPVYKGHDPAYLESSYRHDDGDGRGPYRLDNMASPNPRPNLMYPWKGYLPPGKGWRYEPATMQRLDEEGRIHYPKDKAGNPDTTKRLALKRFLGEQEGSIVTSLWTDIPPLGHASEERLGYPTQKPEALLERILRASSEEGDLVLDPFCGGGTTIAVAQRLNRRWVGIDVTHHAIRLTQHRLKGFGPLDYQTVGSPTTLDGAQALARDNPLQFEAWALALVGANPEARGRGPGDRGVDGRRIFFERSGPKATKRQVVYSVKSGRIPPGTARDLRGTIERERADFGVLLTLREPSRAIREEAMAAGFVEVQVYDGPRRYPRMQCMTVGDLLAGKALDLPPFASAGGDATLRPPPKRQPEPRRGPRQERLVDPAGA